MKKKPFFSIVIPTYNRAHKLHFALHCLSRQSFRDFEVIVSDNCSTDNTKEVIESIKDKRIRYVKNPKPTVYAKNLQNAIDRAQGSYLFLHSDDDLLPDKNALRQIARAVKKSKAGFIRVNYVCIAPDRSSLFYFNPNQKYEGDVRLDASETPKHMLEFMVNADHYFITGLIFKHSFPKRVRLILSEHAPWIDMLLYALTKFGGSFIKEPYVAASWSTWRNKLDGQHPVYSLAHGRLEAEEYFQVIRRYVPLDVYARYVHEQCMQIYVRIFPIIKILIGNAAFLRLVRRVTYIDPSMTYSLRFWFYAVCSILFPSFALVSLRNAFRWMFMRVSAIPQSDAKLGQYRKTEMEFIKSARLKLDAYPHYFL